VPNDTATIQADMHREPGRDGLQGEPFSALPVGQRVEIRSSLAAHRRPGKRGEEAVRNTPSQPLPKSTGAAIPKNAPAVRACPRRLKIECCGWLKSYRLATIAAGCSPELSRQARGGQGRERGHPVATRPDAGKVMGTEHPDQFRPQRV
jgi:hypothetical protein